jgi:hypothetical protein
MLFFKRSTSSYKNYIVNLYIKKNFNKNSKDILKSRNCSIGLTTKVGLADLDRSKLLELSRFDANDFLN